VPELYAAFRNWLSEVSIAPTAVSARRALR
jgi:hypothetical protein